MELIRLAAMAVQQNQQGQPAAAGGQGPGQGNPRGAFQAQQARNRAFGQRSRKVQRNLASFELQAQTCNALGRSRTMDHLVPTDIKAARPRIYGKGQWKVWTPEAILRAAFAKEVLPARAVAAQVDGSSGSYARETRSFIAASLDKEQKEGWARQVAQAQHDAGGRLSYVLCNMMFDETELEVSVQDFGPGQWNILASHTQLTIAVSGEGSERDFDIMRPPMVIPTKQAVTMWPVLCDGVGGLMPGVCEVEAGFKAILVTCDAAAANLKVLRYLLAVTPDDVLLLPTLCAQHRNGNVIERVSKLLGIIPGSFAVAKTMKAGAAIQQLVRALERVMSDALVVRQGEPPGLQEEWAFGRRCSKALLDLVAANSNNAGACGSSEEEPGRRAKIAKEFLDFFAGPWRGPTFRVSCLV